MKIIILILFTISFSLLCSSCKTYKIAENGFTIKEENSVYNINHRVGFPMEKEFYELLNKVDFSSRSKQFKYAKLLNNLGYNRRDYSVLWYARLNKELAFFVLINNNGISKQNKQQLISFDTFNRELIRGSKIYAKVQHRGNTSYYQTIFPFSESLFDEKYISVIYAASSENLKKYKELIDKNTNEIALSLKDVFFPLKYPLRCIDGSQSEMLSFPVPQEIQSANKYILFKVYSDAKYENLVAYTLLDPQTKINSLHLCNEDYFIQYVDTDGQVLASVKSVKK